MKSQKRVIVFLLTVLLLAGIAPLSGGIEAKAQAKTDDSRYLAYYAPVINNYKTVIKNNYYRSKPYVEDVPKYVATEYVNLKRYDTTSSETYYALFDINHNGFPELIIGDRMLSDNTDWCIYSIFSYTDNKIKTVAYSTYWGYRIWGEIFKNGTIVEGGSGGAALHQWSFYRLNKNDQPKRIATIVYNGWNGEKYFSDPQEKTEISKQKAFQQFKALTGQSDLYNYKSDVKLNWKRINDLPGISTLPKPAGVKVSAANTTALNLKWNKVKGAKGYIVYLYNASTKTYTKLLTTHKTIAKITDLTPDTTYQFAVRAYSKPAQKYLYSGYSSLLRATTAC